MNLHKLFLILLLSAISTMSEAQEMPREVMQLVTADGSQVELFSFQNPPARPSYPEARGLRHLAFEVEDVDLAKRELESKGVVVEPIRIDEYTNRRFVFFADPDGLPLELYEAEPETVG